MARPPVRKIGVLDAGQFDFFLERERSLADRGSRRFSLLVLDLGASGAVAAEPLEAFSLLATQATERLRSTDLVGRMDESRVEFLLTDTDSEGAQVVAHWAKEAARKLGLKLEFTIFVYPVVTAPSPGSGLKSASKRSRGNGSNGSNGSNGARPKSPTRPFAAHSKAVGARPVAQGRFLTSPFADPSPRVAGTGSLAAPPWQLADLWPEICTPTPPLKRCLDIVVASLALVALSPIFLLIAIAIRLDSPGPLIFKQIRAGLGGRPFVFYKFRSMTADAEQRQAELGVRNEQDGPVFKIRDDPRITRVGRLLRRSSADELPQLWNVLKGDISLVGPRSPTLTEVAEYEPWQLRRLSVIGGITCTWQVSGRSQIGFRDWMRLDMRYIASRSFWVDLGLLLRTLPAVISRRGAY